MRLLNQTSQFTQALSLPGTKGPGRYEHLLRKNNNLYVVPGRGDLMKPVQDLRNHWSAVAPQESSNEPLLDELH
jgi:hypothetical protein